MQSNPLLPYKLENVLSNENHKLLIEKIRSYINLKEKFISAEMGEGETTAGPGVLAIEIDKGRALYNFENDIPEELMSIFDILIKEAKKIDNSVTLRNIVYSKYSNDYGLPQLFPHMDEPDELFPTSFLIDYELDSNTDWKIGIDGEYFSLKNNSFLAFDVIRKSHYREPKIFKDDEYVEMIFLYFINGKNFPVPNHEQQFLECKSIKKEFYKNKIVYFLNNKNKKEILKNVIKKNNFSSETKEISDEKLNYLINKYNSCKQIINNECLDKHELCQQRKRILFYFTEDQRYSE